MRGSGSRLDLGVHLCRAILEQIELSDLPSHDVLGLALEALAESDACVFAGQARFALRIIEHVQELLRSSRVEFEQPCFRRLLGKRRIDR